MKYVNGSLYVIFKLILLCVGDSILSTIHGPHLQHGKRASTCHLHTHAFCVYTCKHRKEKYL